MQTYLEKRQPAHNVARFYRMSVMPNLFGEWTLYREWGRIGQGGQVRMDWFSDEVQAVAALVTLETSKRQRGYWVEPQQLAMFG
jgi:predicted DNA-binding WGR domain protein